MFFNVSKEGITLFFSREVSSSFIQTDKKITTKCERLDLWEAGSRQTTAYTSFFSSIIIVIFSFFLFFFKKE